jgi:hypothetical protein
MTKYQCSKCGIVVVVVDGKMITTCSCNVPVVANIQATARGAGGIQRN